MKRVLPSLFLVIILGACASSGPRKRLREKTLAVVVLPPINITSAADAPDLYLSSVLEPLANRGYYVFPIELTQQTFLQEGVTSGEQLKDVPITKYRKLFGADAVLKTKIDFWDTSYLLMASYVVVGVTLELISTTTGKVLWSAKDKESVSIDGGGGESLLVKLVATAVATAAVDYVEVAQKLNAKIFRRLPIGPYHRSYSTTSN